MCLVLFNEDTIESFSSPPPRRCSLSNRSSAPLLAAVLIVGSLGLTREVIIYVLSRFKGICFFLCGSNQRRVWFCSPHAALHSWHLGVLERSIGEAPFLGPRAGRTPPGRPPKPEQNRKQTRVCKGLMDPDSSGDVDNREPRERKNTLTSEDERMQTPSNNVSATTWEVHFICDA